MNKSKFCIPLFALTFLGVAQSVYADESWWGGPKSWMGLEFGTLSMSAVTAVGTGAATLSASGSTPIVIFRGEVCSATFGTAGEISQIYGNFGVVNKKAPSVLGLDCSFPFWEQQLDLVDVSLNLGLRYRYHSQFSATANTYSSVPVSVALSKDIGGGLTPYGSVGFGPVGFLMKDKYGKFSTVEAGLNWQFAKNWKMSASYNKTHDEAKEGNSSLNNLYQYDATMTAVGIHYYW